MLTPYGAELAPPAAAGQTRVNTRPRQTNSIAPRAPGCSGGTVRAAGLQIWGLAPSPLLQVLLYNFVLWITTICCVFVVCSPIYSTPKM